MEEIKDVEIDLGRGSNKHFSERNNTVSVTEEITMTSLTHKLRTRQIISPGLDIDWETVLDGMYKSMEVPDERSSDA